MSKIKKNEPITELKGLNVEEISLVARPANERKFLLLKQKGGFTVEELDNVLKSLEDLEIDLENEESIEKAMKKAKMSDSACKAVKGALKLMSAYKEQMPKDIMGKLAMMAGYGYPEMEYEAPAGDMTGKAKGKNAPPDVYAPPVVAPKKMKKDDGSLDLDAVPQESRELVSMLWKEHESAVQKAKDLEKDLQIERDIRVTKEFLDKGSKFPNIGAAEIVGSVLRKAFDVSDEYGKQLEGILKDADAKIENSELFVEKGSSATSNANTAWAKIEELAKGFVQKGDGTSMAQAIDRVLAENPKLYDEYSKERSGK